MNKIEIELRYFITTTTISKRKIIQVIWEIKNTKNLPIRSHLGLYRGLMI